MKIRGLKSMVLAVGIIGLSVALAAAQPTSSGPPAAGPSEQMSQHQMPGQMKAQKMHKRPGMMCPKGQEMGEMKHPPGPGMKPAGKRHSAMGPHRPEMGFIPFMAPLHRWMGALMAQGGPIALTSEQISRLDDLISSHLQSAIRGKAEIRALRVELKRLLRKDSLNMQSVEALLKKISQQELAIEIAGFAMYQRVLEVLTPEQRQTARDLIGKPFPAPWEEMSSPVSPRPTEKTAAHEPSGQSEPEREGGQPWQAQEGFR